MRYIDITTELGPATRVYPGDPPVEISLHSGQNKGQTRVSSLRLSAHAGTHVDAPCHMAGDRRGVESLSLDVLIGRAVVIDAPRRLDTWLDIPVRPRGRPSRMLFKGEPALTAAFARELIGHGVRLVGTDGLSVDAVGDERLPAHRILLKAGVVILEGLNLSKVAAGRYDLVALPLLIPGCDGAPARAALRKT